MIVLVELPVLAKWFTRKTTLRMPFCGKEIISMKPRLKNSYDFQFNVLFHCSIVY